jgi:hypothetical protein
MIWIFIMGVIVWWWVAYALALRKERERQKHVDDRLDARTRETS